MNKGLRLKGSLYLAENNSNMPGHTPLPEPVLLRLSVSLGNKLHFPLTINAECSSNAFIASMRAWSWCTDRSWCDFQECMALIDFLQR